MSLFWALISTVCVLIGIVTLVDIVRHRHLSWGTAGWVALVVILPFIGSLAYWLTRRTPSEEIEGRYLVEAERRRSGFGPGRTSDDLATQRERDHF